jgi:hypothetical protein
MNFKNPKGLWRAFNAVDAEARQRFGIYMIYIMCDRSGHWGVVASVRSRMPQKKGYEFLIWNKDKQKTVYIFSKKTPVFCGSNHYTAKVG